MRAMTLDVAIQRLDAALSALEAATARRAETERRRGDLETELALMQDDRARLAVELDGALAKLNRLEAAADDVNRRVDRAMGVIRDVIGSSPTHATQ
jgi:chromosome segregation ATPase